jgi:hypothetical protein
MNELINRLKDTNPQMRKVVEQGTPTETEPHSGTDQRIPNIIKCSSKLVN